MENYLSKSVRILCKQQGITMKELAERMQIAPESLSRAINGNPQLSTIRKIAECLNVEVAYLFTHMPEEVMSTPLPQFQSQKNLLHNIPQISDGQNMAHGGTNHLKVLNNELVAMVRFRNSTLATSDLTTLTKFINTIVKIKRENEEN